jgi:UDP-2-acetamido-3-amino-2,3-dideoxy-glucuronate N-acetyltransferase
MRHFHESVKIHSSALIEEDVQIGTGSSVWDNVHIRYHTKIGSDCIIGEKSYIAYDVRIGDKVKINAFVYICTQVIIEDWVMISAGTVFTNDKFPRAVDPSTGQPLTSIPTEETLKTYVRRGVTIGANATIGPGLEIGNFALVGMGSVVTHNVLPYTLVVGNPARVRGYVCQCGSPLTTFKNEDDVPEDQSAFSCSNCQRDYKIKSGQCIKLST